MNGVDSKVLSLMSFILRIVTPLQTPLDFMSPTMGEIEQITKDVLKDRLITSTLKAQVIEKLQKQFPTYSFEFEESE